MSEIEKAIKYLLFLKAENNTPSIDIKLTTAIQALQATLERDKGCEYCMHDKNCKVCKWTRLCNGRIKDNRCTARDYKFESDDYCKFCGRKLVE